MRTGRRALVLGTPRGAGVPDVVGLARLAEDRGYEAVLTQEAGGTDAITTAAAAVTATSSIAVMTGILPVPGRAPAVIAMEAATLQALSGGRFTLGLGASTPAVSRWRGDDCATPVARLRELVEVLRPLLRGERLRHTGDAYDVDFRLQFAVSGPTPIALAGLGPRTLRIAGELAEGAILSLAGRQGLAWAHERLEEGGRHRAADLPARPDLVARWAVLPEEVVPAGEAESFARGLVGGYLTTAPYRTWVTRQGFGAVVERFWSRWQAGDRNAAEVLDDDVLSLGVLRGPAAAIGDELRALTEGGELAAIWPVGRPGSTGDRSREETAEIVRLLAPTR